MKRLISNDRTKYRSRASIAKPGQGKTTRDGAKAELDDRSTFVVDACGYLFWQPRNQRQKNKT